MQSSKPLRLTSGLCVLCVQEEYAILKQLYCFRGPSPDADEVRPSHTLNTQSSTNNNRVPDRENSDVSVRTVCVSAYTHSTVCVSGFDSFRKISHLKYEVSMLEKTPSSLIIPLSTC